MISFVLFITLADIFVGVHKAPWLLRLLKATPSIGSLMRLVLGLFVFKLDGFDSSFLGCLII